MDTNAYRLNGTARDLILSFFTDEPIWASGRVTLAISITPRDVLEKGITREILLKRAMSRRILKPKTTVAEIEEWLNPERACS
jgi:hypothetical protein